MHSYYFVVQDGCVNGRPATERVTRIQKAAHNFGMNCHTEVHGDTVTLQIETEELDSAVAFKLAADQALHEVHD